MVAYLNKSDAREGFNQIIDFLNGNYVAYALTVNPTIYVSCIKQFWNTVAVNQSHDVTSLPNEEIFTTLARMGYEKPSTKLTFYKAFFSSQWKFLIHMILQSMSAKRTSWNEFSSAMASVVICLAISPKELENQGDAEEQGAAEEQGHDNTAVEEPVTAVYDVADQSIQSPTPLTPPPQQPQDIPSTSQVQSSPPPAQPQGAHFPISLLQEALDACAALTRRVEHQEDDKRIDSLDDTLMEDMSNQGRVINESNKDKGAELMNEKEEKETEEVRVNPEDAQVEGRHADIYHIDIDHATKVLSMQEDEPEIQEALEVVTTAKLITEVVAAISKIVCVAAVVQADVPAALVNAAAVVTTSKDKGKGIMVEEPKPIKKKQQVELDEAYARKLQEELNQDIDWENTAGFTLDYFKGMYYDDIRPIFEAKFNANLEFLLKSKEQIEEEERRAIALINETPA
nr:hypothetical protein [Tanacetum cinerariifolium]